MHEVVTGGMSLSRPGWGNSRRSSPSVRRVKSESPSIPSPLRKLLCPPVLWIEGGRGERTRVSTGGGRDRQVSYLRSALRKSGRPFETPEGGSRRKELASASSRLILTPPRGLRSSLQERVRKPERSASSQTSLRGPLGPAPSPGKRNLTRPCSPSSGVQGGSQVMARGKHGYDRER